jgi:hypothetical protein
MTNDEPLDPSGIAQFVKHDRCPRYIKQRVDPGDEPNARDWREAFGLMNVALLGNGQEFEAKQVEALATQATKIIGPALDDQSKAGVPDIPVDEQWADSTRGRADQLRTAVADAKALSTTTDVCPYILCYQAPLGGKIGIEDIWGEADCLVLAPAAATPDDDTPSSPATHVETETAAVTARVIDIKSASEQQPAHRIQVAVYSRLLEQTLAKEPTPDCRIETSVLTQATAADPGTSLHPFDLPTFRRAEWELFVERLLAADGPIDEALTDDLADLPFTLDQVCDNCAYREACATRAVEDPTDPASLAVLGFGASVQRALRNAGITTLRELSDLLPRLEHPQPTDDPPTLDLPSDQRRTLEEALPGPIHETVQRAQALRGELDPDYPAARRPPALPGTDWVPLPDDRCTGWSNIEDAEPGELIHVALFVRPDSAINRIAALGGCVYAEAHDEYLTIGEVIDAVPDDPDVADEVERDLFERFLGQLFDAIEAVARELGDPSESVVHCYTFSDHERETLAEGLDRHADTLDRARALRALCSLHRDGHTDVDQSMVSAVQPVVNDHFALQYPSQSLLNVVDQFVPNWTIEAFDPLDARPDDPPLRAIFREQFLNERVPYLTAEPGIRLHLGRGPLAEGPAPAAADTDADAPSPDGWYPIRKRAGGQFPIEYIWAVTPKHPDESTPRLTPDLVEEWAIDDEHEPLYRQEIQRFSARTNDGEEPLQRGDVEYLVERLSYALLRLVDAIPYKDTYHEKAPLDATQLDTFELPVANLPDACRDYLGMEFGAQRDATEDHYRQSLRKRARTGRSIPIRCTGYEHNDDGSLTITGELAYNTLFEDTATARQVASQARVRGGAGPGGGSWRVLTRLTPEPETQLFDADRNPLTRDNDASARDYTAAGVEAAADIKHSPPVLVDQFDQQAGTVTLTAFPHRFQCNGSRFRVDHCGWASPTGSNVEDPDASPATRSGYVAGRAPVRIDTGEVFMLDPMVDDLSAPKAERALSPDTIGQNALWSHLQSVHRTSRQLPVQVCSESGIEQFLQTMADADACLEPNEHQEAFIRAIDRPLVPLQGPPGTGKTSGATAPALLARAFARASAERSFFAVAVAPSHEAVDALLDGVVDVLGDWRTSTGGLADLDLVRVLPSPPPRKRDRVDATTPTVDVTYCNYNADAGETRLQALAEDIYTPTDDPDTDPTQCILFATPATLYKVLGVVADTIPAIDEDSAPAAMRHDEGLADVVCIDEASMLDLPQLFLAGSALTPRGQTLLVGDHRQLATVTQVDWTDTLRKPLADLQAYQSALDYVRLLNAGATTAPDSSSSDNESTHSGSTGSQPDPDSSDGADTGGATR